jgi:hypothetical protein
MNENIACMQNKDLKRGTKKTTDQHIIIKQRNNNNKKKKELNKHLSVSGMTSGSFTGKGRTAGNCISLREQEGLI